MASPVFLNFVHIVHVLTRVNFPSCGGSHGVLPWLSPEPRFGKPSGHDGTPGFLNRLSNPDPTSMEPLSLQPRGVYRALCLSPQGEMILYAVTHLHRLLDNPSCVYVPKGDNPFPIEEQLWDRLNQVDPVQNGQESLPAAS